MRISDWSSDVCSSDLRTRATPVSNSPVSSNAPGVDGSLGSAYRISGSKMWISAGEHELTENIVHMVMARIAGAPAGVRGISLFIVPKRRVEVDGSLGPGNAAPLMGLTRSQERRVGTEGVSTCRSRGEPDP